ncbi:MAG: hypothetical protein JSV03_15935 [Planctomycetota bacterium]|nr:MAG: hypothetical protein JSV03_15935 [Planctomycetota bacterium]
MALRRCLFLIVVTICLSYPGPAGAGVYRIGAEPLVAWHAHPYQWVVNKDVHLGVRANLLLVRMAQNEWEHTAFALTNTTDQPRKVRLDVSCEGVPPQAIHLRRVVMFEGAGKDVFHLAWKANEPWTKPELLEPVDGPLTLPPKTTAHLWITIHSRNLDSGRYQGWVRVLDSHDDSETCRIPLSIEVWPFSLPEKSGLLFYLWQHLPGPAQLADQVARLLTAYGVNMALFEIPPLADGRLVTANYDWLERLKIARRWDFIPVFEMRKEFVIKPEQDRFNAVAKVAALVRKLGFEDWYFYMSDEVRAEKFHSVIDECERLREVNPEARIAHALWFKFESEKWEEEIRRLSDYSDLWCMFRNYASTDIFHGIRWKDWPTELYDLLADRQKQGARIMYYHNTWRSENYMDASFAWTRPEGWYCWLNGYDGFGGFNGDTAPHIDAPGVYTAKTVKVFQFPIERQSICIPYYIRPIKEGRYAAVGTKSLEGYRDGLRDYMYLLILDDLIRQADESDKPELISLARQARATIEDTIKEVRLHIHSYYAYCHAKRRLALEIIKLMEMNLSPRLDRDGTILRHRQLIPEKIYAPEAGGVSHPLSG